MRKGLLSLSSLIVSAVVVYGMAVCGHMFGKDFVLEKGLSDMGYLFLTIGIALPVILYIAFVNKKHEKNIIKVSLFGVGISIMLFAPAYLTMTLDNSALKIHQLYQFSAILLFVSFSSTMMAHVEWKKEKQ